MLNFISISHFGIEDYESVVGSPISQTVEPWWSVAWHTVARFNDLRLLAQSLGALSFYSAGAGAPGGGFGVWLRHLGTCDSSEGSNMILTPGLGEQ